MKYYIVLLFVILAQFLFAQSSKQYVMKYSHWDSATNFYHHDITMNIDTITIQDGDSFRIVLNDHKHYADPYKTWKEVFHVIESVIITYSEILISESNRYSRSKDSLWSFKSLDYTVDNIETEGDIQKYQIALLPKFLESEIAFEHNTVTNEIKGGFIRINRTSATDLRKIGIFSITRIVN